MRILIQFPTRERREKFFVVLEQYYRLADDISKCLFHIVIDADDLSMNNATVLNMFDSIPNCDYTISKIPGKVKAINTLPPDRNWNIVLLLSDDMIVKKRGWDTDIRTRMRKFYPNTDGVLWYNDGFIGDKLNTLVCMGKKYFDRFGYIYHPSYISLWSDNEFTEVATRLGKQTYIPECIIRHEHCIYMGNQRDSLCNRNENWYCIDKQNYESRRARGFK